MVAGGGYGSSELTTIRTPEPFDFKPSENWPKWKKQFEQFWVASGLAKEDEPRQVNTLLYCLSEEADDVLASTSIIAEGKKKYAMVLEKFDTFFQVKKNVTSSKKIQWNSISLLSIVL